MLCLQALLEQKTFMFYSIIVPFHLLWLEWVGSSAWILLIIVYSTLHIIFYLISELSKLLESFAFLDQNIFLGNSTHSFYKSTYGANSKSVKPLTHSFSIIWIEVSCPLKADWISSVSFSWNVFIRYFIHIVCCSLQNWTKIFFKMC